VRDVFIRDYDIPIEIHIGDTHIYGIESAQLALRFNLGMDHWLSVPYPFLMLLCVPLLLWWVLDHRSRRTASATGLCPACAYDLRATPGRCPECGSIPSTHPVKPFREFTVSRGFAGTMVVLCILFGATPLRLDLDRVGVVALTAGGLITLVGWPYPGRR
jgi:hypothetical protein